MSENELIVSALGLIVGYIFVSKLLALKNGKSGAEAGSPAGSVAANRGEYDIPGYDSSWSHSAKKDFLRAEFTKWNSRINSATNSVEREKIQRLLDEIARARLDLQFKKDD